MAKSNAVKKQERNVRRLVRNSSDKSLRNQRDHVNSEIRKLEKQLAALNQEACEYTLALQLSKKVK